MIITLNRFVPNTVGDRHLVLFQPHRCQHGADLRERRRHGEKNGSDELRAQPRLLGKGSAVVASRKPAPRIAAPATAVRATSRGNDVMAGSSLFIGRSVSCHALAGTQLFSSFAWTMMRTATAYTINITQLPTPIPSTTTSPAVTADTTIASRT